MSGPTEQPLRDYYREQALDESALRRIHESALFASPGKSRRARRKPLAAAAVVLVLLLAGGALVWRAATPDVTELVAREVRTNYAKDLEPEVRAGDFAELAAGLPRLGFALTPTLESVPLAGWRVVGGRYCSLVGELAAQVNLTDEAGREALLYVVPLVGGLRAVEVGPHSHEDADIHVWKDARRLYVQAIPKR